MSGIQPNVRVILRGLIAVFARDGYFEIAILKNAPGHKLQIDIEKEGSPLRTIKEGELKDQLEIKVEDISSAAISFRDKPINRKQGPDPANRDSYRWVIDFDGELYHKPIGAKRSGFSPILKMNSGEFFTAKISDNELITMQGATSDVIGPVAVRAGIEVVLDKPTSTATFTNGAEEIFKADNKSHYDIFIERGCNNSPGGNDAEMYYSAIGHLVPASDKIRFSSTPLSAGTPLPSDPDATCPITFMSQSPLER